MGLALFVVLGMFWAPAFLATAAYYSVSILVLGNTPGCVFLPTRQSGIRACSALRCKVRGSTGSRGPRTTNGGESPTGVILTHGLTHGLSLRDARPVPRDLDNGLYRPSSLVGFLR